MRQKQFFDLSLSLVSHYFMSGNKNCFVPIFSPIYRIELYERFRGFLGRGYGREEPSSGFVEWKGVLFMMISKEDYKIKV